MSAMGSNKVSVYLSDSQISAVKSASDWGNIKMSEFIKEVLVKYLIENGWLDEEERSG